MNVFCYGREIPVSYKELDHAGEYLYEEREIVIDSEQTDREKIISLIHEGMHGQFDRTGLHDHIPMAIEEMICEMAANFIDDNFDIKLKET